MHIPNIKFAKSGDANIAYERHGSGPDVVLIPPLIANVELGWEQEVYRRAREHHFAGSRRIGARSSTAGSNS